MANWIITVLLSAICIKAVVSDTTTASCDVTTDPNLNSTIDGDTVTGTVTFTQVDDGDVTVEVLLTGFDTSNPSTLHGFHVHMTGDISGGCASTGGHYNPDSVDHGLQNDTIRHVGDLGNVEEDGNGDVDTTIVDSVISLTGDQSIIGRAIVIHANEDIGSAGDASGSAGTRLACCVIIDTTPESSASSVTLSFALFVIGLLFALG